MPGHLSFPLCANYENGVYTACWIQGTQADSVSGRSHLSDGSVTWYTSCCTIGQDLGEEQVAVLLVGRPVLA